MAAIWQPFGWALGFIQSSAVLTGRMPWPKHRRMFDLRPVGYLLGVLVAMLGGAALVPAGLAYFSGETQAEIFLMCAFISGSFGGVVALACVSPSRERLNIQQVFLLTTLVWLVLPLFGALPFWMGAPEVSYLDAFFEAMSGLTTTGATIIVGLDELPRATLLWRGMLQWFGGVGVVVVAMALLPALRVGGMQIFRTEGFDTMGKILPRATEISISISYIYVTLTGVCFLAYAFAGMNGFDALVHALTTIATGGFSNSDASFGAYKGAPEYVGVVFMVLASLPFVRYVQLVNGTAQPLWRDSQIRAFLKLIALVVLILVLFRLVGEGQYSEIAFREALFNVTSVMTGTGYASTDYQLWGEFSVAVFFVIGLIGGCAGSTCCSVKVFRYQLLVSAIITQVRQIHSPSGLFVPRYEGRAVSFDVFSSVISFFVMFITTLLLVAAALSLTGADFITSLSGAAAALANIGPGLGDQIGPVGNYASQSDSAKLILAAAMLIGRLELLSVFVLFSAAFWRR